MIKKLQDKVALITGSTRGIGLAIAKLFASEGASVVLNYCQREDTARSAHAEIEKSGARVYVIKANIADSVQAAQLVSKAIAAFGRIDILVNNAGITRDSTLRKLDTESWQQVIDVNLSGMYHVTRPLVGHMQEHKSGAIINMASIVGQIGNFGQTNYAAAKAGVIGFTKSLALELARYQIPVNAICPGFVDTDMTRQMPESARQAVLARIPMGRLALPEEVAQAALYLATEAKYMTGQTLNINGGMAMI